MWLLTILRASVISFCKLAALFSSRQPGNIETVVQHKRHYAGKAGSGTGNKCRLSGKSCGYGYERQKIWISIFRDVCCGRRFFSMFSSLGEWSTHTHLRLAASAAQRDIAALKKFSRKTFSCLVGGDICCIIKMIIVYRLKNKNKNNKKTVLNYKNDLKTIGLWMIFTALWQQNK